jgi:hypothetical protein
LLEPHFSRTAERVSEEKSDSVLLIQDSTFLNYTSHKAKTEIGRIGLTGKREQYGLIQHNSLCVTEKNEPLGLLDLRFNHNDEFNTTIHNHHRKTQETILDRWLLGLDASREKLKNTHKKIITVADREGDFFEFLYNLVSHEDLFVIRAKHNRYTGDKYRHRGKKLFDLLEEEKEIGKFTVEINDVHTRTIKAIELSTKCLKNVSLPPPDRSKERDLSAYKAIQVNVVMAFNENYRWILLTRLPIDHLSEIRRVIEIYRCRWHIEDFHKILKTAYQVEEIYLHASRQTIENALSMAAISACRFYWMLYVGRVETDCKADRVFEDYEWKTAYFYFKELIPLEPPPLSEIIYRIARFGGHKVGKQNLPGIKTMWLGFQFFTVATNMYQNIISSTTKT